jgi:hypothetical protein
MTTHRTGAREEWVAASTSTSLSLRSNSARDPQLRLTPDLEHGAVLKPEPITA